MSSFSFISKCQKHREHLKQNREESVMSTERNRLAGDRWDRDVTAGTSWALSLLLLSPLCSSVCFLFTPCLLSEGPCPFIHQRSSHSGS